MDIKKYKLETVDYQTINVPKIDDIINFKDQFLNLEIQNNEPCIWCLVDDGEPTQEIGIVIFGTGMEIPILSKNEYLGTYMLRGGDFVYHVFLEL